MTDRLLTVPASLRRVADSLNSAERLGAVSDSPEGGRYIIVSDTLAQRWAEWLNEIAAIIVAE